MNQLTSRRNFIKTSGAAALGGALSARPLRTFASPPSRARSASHEPMRALFDSLSAEQRKAVCFDWDYRVDIKYGRKPLHFADPNGVLLRTHMANAWLITPQLLGSEFYTDKQRALVLEVMKTVLAPGWTEKFQQQAEDDYGPWGNDQALRFSARRTVSIFNSSSPVFISRCARAAAWTRPRRSAAASRTGISRRVSSSRPGIRGTCGGINPCSPTRCMRCSTRSSAAVR